MTHKDRYKEVIIAATVWACCPKAGSYEEDDEFGGPAVEDTCENLATALAVLNGNKELPELDKVGDAIKLGKKLARWPK
jgi:hypothetical protein